jgi:hypothetical protein
MMTKEEALLRFKAAKQTKLSSFSLFLLLESLSPS